MNDQANLFPFSFVLQASDLADTSSMEFSWNWMANLELNEKESAKKCMLFTEQCFVKPQYLLFCIITPFDHHFLRKSVLFPSQDLDSENLTSNGTIIC